MSKPDAISSHLAGLYRVVGVVPGRVYTPSHGIVDLRTMELSTAQELMAGGQFPYLKPIKPKRTASTAQNGGGE